MLQPGETIGEWIVDCPIGEGGMGAVYRCHSSLSERIVSAVKVLKPHDLGQARERFVREVELLASVQHEAVVRVLGGGEDEKRGVLYLAMEMLEGETLEDRISRGALTWEEACALFTKLGEGLLFAHRKGVVHRDIKPQNIMITKDGAPKLLDFGIAVQQGATRLTKGPGTPGTASYMAPEVFQGDRPDHRADIYALGQVLWESLTGKLAFPEDLDTSPQQAAVQLMGQKLKADALDPGKDCPEALRHLIQHSTEPEPESRLDNLEPFVSVLRTTGNVQTQAPATYNYTRPPLPPKRATQSRSSSWPIAMLGVSLVLVLLIVGVGNVCLLGLVGLFASGAVGGSPTLTTTTNTRTGGMPASMFKSRDAIPDGFPLPVAEDARIIQAMRNESAGTVSFTVTYMTELTPQALIDLYTPELDSRRMAISHSSTESTDGTSLMMSGYVAPGETISVYAGPNPAFDGTMCSVTWIPVI